MKKNKYITLELVIPGHKNFLPVALTFIDEACKSIGVKKEDSLKIRLASEEAIVNVIEHGLCNNINELFKILFIDKIDRIEIIIKEKGTPFDIEREYKINKENEKNKGLGLLLIKNSIDEIYFKNLGREGKETRLVKYKSPDNFKNFYQISRSEPTEKPIKVNFYIRHFKEEDAIEISKCAYYAYGYSYEPFIYYPEQIIRMNRDKKLISLIPVTEDGDIAGHAALKFNSITNAAAEMGVAFVKPKYRNNGISEALADYIIDMAKYIKNLKCLYVRVVTAHIYSQKPFYKRKFTPSGIYLGLFPQNVEFKGITGEVITKTSGLLNCFYLKNAEKRTIYIPEKHKNIITKIFDDLNIEYKIGNNLIPIDETEENIEYFKSEIFNCAEIYCKSFGKNTPNLIGKTLRRLLAQKIDVVYLYLDLENPYTPYIVEKCEQMGFFFSGILPFGIYSHHALILQYLNTFIDIKSIKLLDPKAIQLFENIKPYINI